MDKVILITTNIAPYRLRWAEELSKYFGITIYYSKEKEKYYWDNFLKNSSSKCNIVKMNNKKDDDSDPLCFDVIDIIKKNKDSFIIFDGYGPKTNLLGLLYCKINRINNFVNVDGYPTERKKSLIKEIVKKFVIGKLCKNFFCSGQEAKDYLVSYGADKNKVYIHNFSSITKDRILNKPLTKENKLNIRKKLNIDYEGNIVLGVGRFIPLKRFEDLIEAVKRCNSECRLYLLGGKPTKSYLELSKDTDKIHFIDSVAPEEVDEYYQMANLFVLPSETDVWGLVMNEAMANGLPIIASDSPVGAKSLVKDNGCIFKTYDVEELSKDIDYCLKEENNLKMSLNSLKIIKEYTIEGMVERQVPVINNYIKGGVKNEG